MPKVTLSNGKVFEAPSEASILDGAGQAHIVLEHSCRSGRCGICISEVDAVDKTKVLQPETALSQQDIDSGKILTCCRAAEKDLALDIEDLGALGNIQVKTLPCRIQDIQAPADDVRVVTLRTPPSSKLTYLPGQYVNMIIDGGVRRSYSLANAPRADGHLELHIRRVAEGELSDYWFNRAKNNDLLRLEGPFGTFSLRQKPLSHLFFLATGTGIAPIKAMLEQLQQDPALFSNVDISVYWGNRYIEDIYCSLPSGTREIDFIPVLSQADDVWKGRRGYVQDALLEDFPDLSQAQIYACGSERMIKSARSSLMVAGIEGNQFHSDVFVSSN